MSDAPNAVVGSPTVVSRLVTWRRRIEWSTPVIWWLPIALMVASEYKLRKRANDQTLSGSVDPFIVLELGVYALVGLYLLIRVRPHIRAHIITVWTVGWCLTAAISTVYSPFPVLALVRGVQLIIIVLTVLQFVEDGDVSLVRRFVHGYVVLVTVSIAIGLAYVAPQTGEQAGRFTWLFTHSVVAGSMLAMSTVLLFAMWLTHRVAQLPWARWSYGLLLIVNAVSLVRTRTRGSIGAALIALLAITLLWLRAEGKRDLLVTSLVAVSAVALTVGGPIVTYYLRNEDAAKLASFNNRTEVWTIAIAAFERRPLHGLGLTASRGVFLQETGLGGAHNAYINVLVDVGLVGMFWWGGLLLMVLFTGWRLRRRVRRIAGAEPLVFDTVAIVGLMVCQIVNGVTAEYMGAAVGAASLMLYLTGAWVVIVSDACDSIVRDSRAATAVLNATRARPIGAARPSVPQP
jgi:exopolysaccharide production protein ExoQ